MEDVAAARELLRKRACAAWMRSRGKQPPLELSPEQRRRLREAFSLLDSDGSGELDAREVIAGFAALSLPTSAAAVRAMMRAMATNAPVGASRSRCATAPPLTVTYEGFERLVAARSEGGAHAEVAQGDDGACERAATFRAGQA